MTLFWFIFPVVVFIVVLSWTDLHSHVGYAFSVAMEEGLFKFPVIWFQSFFIPLSFLCVKGNDYDLQRIVLLERALRIALSDPDAKLTYNHRYEHYNIVVGSGSVNFYLPDSTDTVKIEGIRVLIPPRLAFMMMKVKDKVDNQKLNAQKGKSLLDS